LIKYPSRKEIESTSIEINPKTIQAIKKWKKEFYTKWHHNTNEAKINKLNSLIYYIQKSEKNIQPLKTRIGTEYKYDPDKKVIYHNLEKPSIISTLHELAHHVFGESELVACTWSIQAFKKSFPNSFSKLKWENHLLVKK